MMFLAPLRWSSQFVLFCFVLCVLPANLFSIDSTVMLIFLSRCLSVLVSEKKIVHISILLHLSSRCAVTLSGVSVIFASFAPLSLMLAGTGNKIRRPIGKGKENWQGVFWMILCDVSTEFSSYASFISIFKFCCVLIIAVTTEGGKSAFAASLVSGNVFLASSICIAFQKKWKEFGCYLIGLVHTVDGINS
ncbi:hypothetical protein HDV57DRAFT_297244 [Trichoderma longibrachiatum]|uniref:Uncharacterized protein n=1 Tax=Trichoderma longibrachiatum ATCC 18648 TaxID=983965 RepID=A0A2T4CCS3_TRILO|nr:hypothetical protein M440DRAFT_1166816 [Trichoderma longibrachiatum ATCC 18648]